MTQHITLTDRIRAITGGVMSQIGITLHRLGVHPDAVTLLGFVVVGIAAIWIAQGKLQGGGWILLFALPLDAVDGAVARAMQRKGKFGAILDSSLDRYADGFIFSGLSYHFAVQGEFGLMILVLATLIGSFMVSYVRARAEGLGLSVRVGVLTRMERVIVILVSLIIPGVLEIGLWVLAIGTHFTGLQRLWFVYRALKNRE